MTPIAARRRCYRAPVTTRTPLLLALSLLLGCPSGEPEPDPTPADPCEDSMEQGAVRVFASGLTGGTEGITFSPDGRLFVSRGDAIEEVFPDGSHETLAMIPEQVGLAFWNDELIVASGDAGNGDGLGGIFKNEKVVFVSNFLNFRHIDGSTSQMHGHDCFRSTANTGLYGVWINVCVGADVCENYFRSHESDCGSRSKK